MGRPRVHLSFTPPKEVQRQLEGTSWAVTWADTTSGQPRDELLRDVAGCSAVITLLTDRVDAELLDAAGPQLSIVANLAVGHDNVDKGAGSLRGVVVTNTPGVLDEATADLAFALLLAASRRVVEADRFVRSGVTWCWRPDMFLGLDLSAGTTLGIVGLGRIGLAMARRAHAFRMTVVATPTKRNAAAAAEMGIELMDLEQVLTRSQAVSLHCPLTPETHHLISTDELTLLGPEGVLVNTARGPVVDEEALVSALESGVIRGAGLDVFENEPRVHPRLRHLENVVLLPHIGSAGGATRLRMAQLALDNVRRVLGGGPALTPVT